MVSSLLHVALVAFLVSPLYSFKLSSEENDELQNTCGTNMKEVDRYARKVLDGTPARAGESLWTVAVYTPNHAGNTTYSTGSLFSKSHVLSYDKLFLIETRDGIKYRYDLKSLDLSQCSDGRADLTLPRYITRQVTVYLDMLKADTFRGKKQLQVSKVRILNGCANPKSMNRVAILELTRAVEKDQRARPICLGSDSRPEVPMTFYGFGDNRGDVMDATLRHTEVTEVPCHINSTQFFCVKSEKPLCNGDFGGVAVKKIDGSIKAFGVYVNGPYECAKAHKNTVYLFANLAKVAGHICEEDGVCPIYLPKPQVGSDGHTESIPDSPWATTTLPNPWATTEENGGDGQATTSNPWATPASSEGSGQNESIPNSHWTTIDPNGGLWTTPNPTSVDSNQGTNCAVEIDDDDIHIHIKLGKYIKTGDAMDIEVVRQGPRKQGKRAI